LGVRIFLMETWLDKEGQSKGGEKTRVDMSV